MIYRYHNKLLPVGKVERISRQFKHFYIRKAPDNFKVKFPGGYFIPMSTGTSFVSPVPINYVEIICTESANTSQKELVEIYLSEGPISFGQTSLNSDGEVVDPGSNVVSVSKLPSVRIAANQNVVPRPHNTSMSVHNFHFIFESKRSGETTSAFNTRVRLRYGLSDSALNGRVRVLDNSVANNPNRDNGLASGILVGKYCDLVFGGHGNEYTHPTTHYNNNVNLLVFMSDTAMANPPSYSQSGLNYLTIGHNSILRLEKVPKYFHVFIVNIFREVYDNSTRAHISFDIVIYS